MSLIQLMPSFVHMPWRPPCPVCGDKMALTLIESVMRGLDQRSFECKACDYAEKILFNSQ